MLQTTKTISLQKQLIKNTIKISLALALIGFVGISVTVGYSNNHVFDELLASNAHALLGENDQAYPDIEHSLQYLNDEMDIEYQVMNKEGVIISKTLYSPSTPYLQQFDNNAYYNTFERGELWRVYTSYDKALNRYVQIAQPWAQRLEFALPIVINYAGFMLVFLVVLLIGNSLVIRKNIQPLHDLKSEIQQKHLQDLSSINPKVVLSETLPLLKAINQLFERLTKAKEAQERFTADASHELRTPLSAVQMKLQLLQRKFVHNAEVVSALDDVRSDVGRATALVEGLLTLARLDNDSVMTQKSVVDVNKLLDEVVHVMASEFQLAQAQLIAGYRQQTPANIWRITANEQLLLIALRNLLDNAVRYGGQGVCVQVDVLSQNNQLIIRVQDDGIGVSQADLARLSERFFRVLGSQKTGSGLGLSIVAKIAEYHGGRLCFEQGLNGRGLGVSLCLPWAAHDL